MMMKSAAWPWMLSRFIESLRSLSLMRAGSKLGCHVGVFLCSGLFAAVPSCCVADDVSSFKELVDVLGAREKAGAVYRWKFKHTALAGPVALVHDNKDPVWSRREKHMLSAARKAGFAEVKELSGNEGVLITAGHALVDFATARFLIDLETTVRRPEETVTNKYRFRYCFDGALHWGEMTAIDTNLSPQKEPKQLSFTGPAVVSVGVANGNLENFVMQSGIWALPPFIHLPSWSYPKDGGFSRGSEFIERLANDPTLSKVERSATGGWLTTWTTAGLPGNHVPGHFTLEFDGKQAGALSRVEERHSVEIDPNGPLQNESIRTNVEWKPGFWGPLEVVDYDWLNGTGRKIVFSEMEVDPPLTEDSFNLGLAPGTLVIDADKALNLVVGDTPEFQLKSIQDYVASKFQTIPSAKPASREIKRSGFWLIVGNAVILLALIAVISVKKFRRGGTLLLVFSLAHVPCESHCTAQVSAADAGPRSATAESGARIVWDAGWKFGAQSGKGLNVVECGYTSTLTVLSLFSIDCDALVLSRSLKPTPGGVRMKDMRDVLIAYGLNAEARSDVSLPELLRYLRPGMAALAVVKGSLGAPHYVVICQNSAGQPYLLDPPKSPFSLADGKVPADLDFKDAVVLFCRRDQDRKSVFDISFKTKHLAASEFLNGNASFQLEVTNRGQKPFTVDRVVTPCGCIRASSVSENSVVSPGEKSVWSITVNQNLWGPTNARKTVGFLLSTGERADCEISIERPEPVVLRRSVSIPTACGPCPVKVVESIPLKTLGMGSNAGVRSNRSYCKSTIRGSGDQSMLEIVLEFGADVMERVSKGELEICQLDVSEKGNASGAHVLLSFSRSIKAELNPQSIRLSNGRGRCEITVATADGDWSATEVECSNTSVDCSVAGMGERKWGVTVIAPELRSIALAKVAFSKAGELPVRMTVPILPE
ncbi:MAG: hypothetical protein JWP89_1124 [Schlesneria sp.]|nr:hypothetical protein [Schlesneria sp.]